MGHQALPASAASTTGQGIRAGRRGVSPAGVGAALLLAAGPASAAAASERFRCNSLTAEGNKATDFLNGLPGAAARTSEPAGHARQTGVVPGGI